jgi:hypothetical protein
MDIVATLVDLAALCIIRSETQKGMLGKRVAGTTEETQYDARRSFQ